MKWQTVMQHVRPVRCIVALACVSIALVLSGCAAPAPDVHTPAPAAHAAQVHLSWEPPTTRTDGTPLTDIVGYTLHYGVTSRTYAFIKHLGNQTSCEVSGLEPGRTYFFAVTARDAAGHESAFSDELHTTVPALVDQQLMLWLDPLIRGRETTFQVMGAHPHEVVSFLFSSEGEGEGPCSAQLGGLCGDLLSPSVFGEATADASGLATLPPPSQPTRRQGSTSPYKRSFSVVQRERIPSRPMRSPPGSWNEPALSSRGTPPAHLSQRPCRICLRCGTMLPHLSIGRGRSPARGQILLCGSGFVE